MHTDGFGADFDIGAGNTARLAFADRPQGSRRRLGRILGRVLARDDEPALGRVVEVGIVFGDKAMAARGIDLLVCVLIMPNSGTLNTSAASQTACAVSSMRAAMPYSEPCGLMWLSSRLSASRNPFNAPI